MLASYQPTRNGRSRYFFSPCTVCASTPPPAVPAGEFSETRPLGTRLSSNAVTSATSRPTRVGNLGCGLGEAGQVPGEPTPPPR